jgi:hypothetical protein
MAYFEIADADGRVWRVWETQPQSRRTGGVAEGYASGWLTFESDTEKRRLLPVPPGWEQRDTPGLLELLARALRVERSKREAGEGAGRGP